MILDQYNFRKSYMAKKNKAKFWTGLHNGEPLQLSKLQRGVEFSLFGV